MDNFNITLKQLAAFTKDVDFTLSQGQAYTALLSEMASAKTLKDKRQAHAKLDSFLNSLTFGMAQKARLDTIQEYCESEITKLKTQVSKRTGKVRTLSSIRGVVSKHRRIIKSELGADSVILAFYKLDDSEYKQIKLETAHRNALKKSVGGFVIPLPLIHKAIKQAEKLARSTNFYERVTGLMLLTGRRPIELIDMGGFELTGSNFITSVDYIDLQFNQGSVYQFKGLAKQKGLDREAINIPCLSRDVDVESVISDLRSNNLDYKILQGKITSKRHSEGTGFDLGTAINSLTAFRINRIFKESFNFLIDFHQSLNLNWKLTPYILRHIYSALAWYYIKQDLIARDKWFDNAGLELAARGYVLGHMEGDLETPQIYADIRIVV